MEHFSITEEPTFTVKNKNVLRDENIRFVHMSSRRMIPIWVWFPALYVLLGFYYWSWFGLYIWYDERLENCGYNCIWEYILWFLVVLIALGFTIVSLTDFIKYVKRCHKLKHSNYFMEDKKTKIVIITDRVKFGLLNRKKGKIILPIEYDKVLWNERNQVYEAIKDGRQFLIDKYGKVLS